MSECFRGCVDCREAAASPISTEVGNEQGAAAEAREITRGARRDKYGPPDVNHKRTALLWSAYIHARGRPGALSAEDVCAFNILQKMSRQMHAHDDDNLVDMIGYVLNWTELDAS